VRLTFTKRDGKTDDLTIVRSDGSRERIAAPKQGILPHDMIHYAVECALPVPGFLSMIAAGHPIAFAAMESEPTVEAVERLVETMQAEMWSGRASTTDLVTLYEQTCAARGHGSVPVTEADIAAIRTGIDALTVQWTALRTNASLTLYFLPRPLAAG